MKGKLLAILMITFFRGLSQSNFEFNQVRYNDDFTFLRNDTSKNWYKSLKHNSFSRNNQAYISFGGDVRYQYFYIKNESWGDEPLDTAGFIFTRFLGHADFHLNKYFRLFVQLQSSHANARDLPTSPIDENPLDLHQTFLDFKTDTGSLGTLIIRLGRQEFLYGSQRLVSVREGPNNRLAFDALKLIFTKKSYQADFFFSYPVRAQGGIFDDGLNKNTRFWGGYFVKKNASFFKNIDLYYLGLEKDRAIFDDGLAKEQRHSFGTRIWKKDEAWRYDFEIVYQIGQFGKKEISAWTISSNTGYKFNSVKFTPEIGLKTEAISGDAQQGDFRLQTFNPLFPRGAYFGLAALIGPSNLYDIHPSILLQLNKKTVWTIDYDVFWRYSNNDGIYAPNTMLTYRSGTSNSHFIGQQYSTNIEYSPSAFTSFQTEFTWFKPGNFLNDVSSGKDIFFFRLTMQLSF